MGHQDKYRDYWNNQDDAKEPRKTDASLREAEHFGPKPAADLKLMELLEKAKAPKYPAAEDDLVKFTSGATSSTTPAQFDLVPIEGPIQTAQRFSYGNHKHEHDNTILAEANWLKAFHARDVAFFRDRKHHVIIHWWNEMQGVEDPHPGGNGGAVGWAQAVFAFVKKYDPNLYWAAMGRQALKPHPELHYECPCSRCQATK